MSTCAICGAARLDGHQCNKFDMARRIRATREEVERLNKEIDQARSSLESIAYLAGRLPAYFNHPEGLVAMQRALREKAVNAAKMAGSMVIWDDTIAHTRGQKA